MPHDSFIKKGIELIEDVVKSRVSWLQHILILCSTVLGLLASLHTTTSSSLCIRLVFVLTIVLLVFGILTGALALYGYSVNVSERRRQGYLEEAQKALREGRSTDAVFGKLPRRYELCEKACYICLLLSMALLVSYTIIISFFNY